MKDVLTGLGIVAAGVFVLFAVNYLISQVLDSLGELGGELSGVVIDARVEYADSDADGLIDCRVENGGCASAQLLEGIEIDSSVVVAGRRGYDVDNDGVLDFECDEPSPEQMSIACEELDQPFADRFLLADQTTTVDRIDVDGDRNVDYVVIGDHDPIPLARREPWTMTFLPGLTVAGVSGILALAGVWLAARVTRSEG